MTEDFFVHKDYIKDLDKPNNTIYISYSQFSLYRKCPHHWKLKYVDKIKQQESTIHTLFGNAMHRLIQDWVKILYLESVKNFDVFDFRAKLMEYIKEEYKISLEKNNNVSFTSKEELSEFYLDGCEILAYLKRKRKVYFDRRNEELIGIELPLYVIQNGVCLISYLDLVFREKKTGRIIIKDLKTSKAGWKDYDKSDETKVSQLILYKIYFAKKYNIPIEDIDIEYLILKRKIPLDVAFPIPRVTPFSPASGSVTQRKVNKMFDEFISECFVDGKYNRDKEYVANEGRNAFNCRFCEFSDNEELCPKSKRICQ